MDCIVNDVLKQIKDSEETAIEKQRTLQSLDIQFEEGEKKSIQLDRELVRAKYELKQAEKDEICYLVHLEEIETRLKSLHIQSSNIDKQNFEESKIGIDKMKAIGDSVNKIVQEVNMFTGTYGPNPDDEKIDNLQEKWSLLLHEKLVECKHQFIKLRELEGLIEKIHDDEQRFEKLQTEVENAIKTKEFHELESEELMTDISHLTIERSRVQSDQKVMTEIQNLQDQILSIQSEKYKATSLEHQRKLLNEQFGNLRWSAQVINKKRDREEQDEIIEANEMGDNSANDRQVFLDQGPTDVSAGGFTSARHCISSSDKQNVESLISNNMKSRHMDIKEDLEDVFNLTELADMDFDNESFREEWEDS